MSHKIGCVGHDCARCQNIIGYATLFGTSREVIHVWVYRDKALAEEDLMFLNSQTKSGNVYTLEPLYAH